MKKLILLIAVFALLFSFNKVEAQTKLQTGVPMVIFSADTLNADSTLNEVFFSKNDVTYSVQVITDTVTYTGTQDGYIIRQYSNDGVNFVDIDTLTLTNNTEENDITTFTSTSWTHYYLRFRYDEATADTVSVDITIYAIPNK